MLWNSEKNQVPGIAMALFVIFGGAGLGITALVGNRLPLIVGFVLGLYLLFSIKVADQWEKVAVLRLGRYLGLRGPGWFHMIPIVDTLSRFVDQRVRTANVTAESTPTRDTVPVNVDAIVFWMVWNAEKSILEVQDFVQAITMSAQTGLRESIGRHELAQMITERESLGRELQRILDEKTNPWGITVQSGRWKFATYGFRRRWKTRCHARRRRNVNAKRGSFLARPKRKSRRNSNRLPRFISKTPLRCTCAR